MKSRSMSQKVAVSVVFVSAMFLNIMDVTIVNVALPTIGRQFHVRPDSIDTVAIGYLVSLAVFIPASGWLGDWLGGLCAAATVAMIFATWRRSRLLRRVDQPSGAGQGVEVESATS